MKFISWNVNGLRACMGKGFSEFFAAEDADIFALQETKLQQGQIDFAPEGYHCYWHYALKKGYSGTAVFTKEEPLCVSYGMGKAEEFEGEGRVITLEFPEFFFVTVYTPNAQRELTRLEYRCRWEDAFREYLSELDKTKPVVVCGDMNVAHEEIDLKNAKSNVGNAGFTDEERAKFTELLEAGFADSFRRLYPDRADGYTWWSYMFKARERNVGWRIDYFVVSERLLPRVRDALIYNEVTGSDHCPVGLILE
ncbi:MAG: exodeoxyribonuclease III [Clostridia bacterium]|nr:exodeoxyribonuclease III [Clostridia bacterium]